MRCEESRSFAANLTRIAQTAVELAGWHRVCGSPACHSHTEQHGPEGLGISHDLLRHGVDRETHRGRSGVHTVEQSVSGRRLVSWSSQLQRPNKPRRILVALLDRHNMPAGLEPVLRGSWSGFPFGSCRRSPGLTSAVLGRRAGAQVGLSSRAADQLEVKLFSVAFHGQLGCFKRCNVGSRGHPKIGLTVEWFALQGHGKLGRLQTRWNLSLMVEHHVGCSNPMLLRPLVCVGHLVQFGLNWVPLMSGPKSNNHSVPFKRAISCLEAVQQHVVLEVGHNCEGLRRPFGVDTNGCLKQDAALQASLHLRSFQMFRIFFLLSFILVWGTALASRALLCGGRSLRIRRGLRLLTLRRASCPPRRLRTSLPRGLITRPRGLITRGSLSRRPGRLRTSPTTGCSRAMCPSPRRSSFARSVPCLSFC
mmetsp:Transcript_7261/g.16563  ORF Transcript_7261/g.16563 Transcript_7261/m.16563 type:complete len:421 (-) Transcript_7261:105-1367(-)